MSAIQQLMMSFGSLPDGNISVPLWASGAMAYAISSNGSRVMGIANDPINGPKAWVWSSATGHGESPDVKNVEWVFSTDASTAAAVSSAEGFFSVEMWNGETHRSFYLSDGWVAAIRAISANGNHVAVEIDGVPRIYSNVTSYIASGAGLTYRRVTAPVGYNTYVGIGYLKNDGTSYATVTHTATGQKHLARLAPAAEVFSVVMSSFDTGFDVDGIVAPSDDTDAVVVQSANADYSVVRAHLYDHMGGATLLPNPSGQIWPSSFIGATGTVAGMTTDGINTPFVWTPGGGLVSLAQPMTGDSPSSRVVAPPDGSRLLVLGCPDSTAYPQDNHLFIYDGASYTMLDKPAPTLVSVQSPGEVYASANFGVIGTAWEDSDATTSFWVYINGELVSLGAP